LQCQIIHIFVQYYKIEYSHFTFRVRVKVRLSNGIKIAVHFGVHFGVKFGTEVWTLLKLYKKFLGASAVCPTVKRMAWIREAHVNSKITFGRINIWNWNGRKNFNCAHSTTERCRHFNIAHIFWPNSANCYNQMFGIKTNTNVIFKNVIWWYGLYTVYLFLLCLPRLVELLVKNIPHKII